MARIVQTVYQRAFPFMEVRPDLLEADGSDLRQLSVRSARNMRGTIPQTLAARMGTFFLRQLSATARAPVSIWPEPDMEYLIVAADDGLTVLDAAGRVVFFEGTVPWRAGEKVWIEEFRERTIIGGAFGLYELRHSAGSWLFALFSFSTGAGGVLAQPYWVFDQVNVIRPSARTGSITVEASGPIFTDDHVGLRIRYGRREILITEKLTPTTVRGTVISTLPPSFQINVADASGFRIGDAVVGADTNFQGQIIGIDGTAISVVTISGFEGPDVGEDLSAPDVSSQITSKIEIAPLASTVWDEPLMSKVRGWPRSAAKVAGRLMLLDFPAARDVIAASSVRAESDFLIGIEDDDAIVRKVGDSSTHWLHAVEMPDIILLSDRGVYIIPLRESGSLTPTSFGAVPVDATGSAAVTPVRVEDGVVFVNAGGQGLSAALLDGNIYKKWSVRPLSPYHSHLIRSPTALCGPSLRSGDADKYLFAVNGDGTVAAISWVDSIRSERVGFAPWETAGNFIGVTPAFGGYVTVVDRMIGGVAKRMLEKFAPDAVLDCAIALTRAATATALSGNGIPVAGNGIRVAGNAPPAAYLAGATASIYADGWDVGDHLVASDGSIPTEPDYDAARQIGLNFVCRVKLWPNEIIESPRIGTLRARVLQVVVSVYQTLGFVAVMNRTTTEISAYGFGDDLTMPPVPRTKIYKFTIFGNRDHPEITLEKRRPGPFHILATGQRVQA